MYTTLLIFHSLLRWLVLGSLCYAIFRAYRGYVSKSSFSYWDDAVRHWTATMTHIQLVLGIILYTQSPLVASYWNNFGQSNKHVDITFFGVLHIGLMLIAIILVTITSSLAKRKAGSRAKFKTIWIGYSVALLLIIIAVPWPFSPWTVRPYFR